MPITKQDPNELVVVTFVDEDGTRHRDVNLPRRLISNGTRRAKKDWLIANGQIADPNAAPLPAMDEPAQIQQTVIDDARARAIESRLDAVEQRPLPNAPDAASLERLAISVQRAAISKEEIVQVADEVTASCEQVGRDAQQRLDGLSEQQAALISTVSEAVSEGQTAVGLAIQSLEQQGAAVRAEVLETAETNAIETATEVGRKAAKQVAEAFRPSSVTIASEDPRDVDPESWALRHYGFSGGLVSGDGVFITGAHGITAMVYKGAQGWVETAELLPKVVTATGPSILDQSTQQTTVLASSGTGGGGGGEPLLINRAIPNTPVLIADSSNWAGTGREPESGQLVVEVTALDGTSTGSKGFAVIDFIYQATAINKDQSTQSALLGDLNNQFDLAITVQKTAAKTPAGVSASLPLGATCVQVFLSVVPAGGVTAGGVTQFRVAGDLTWVHPSQATASATVSSRQPLWRWI